ncbi:hypothetical protein EM595_3377 [Duffyella gerundensis]|uniref:Uncharacterized protein n=1 Tax=Duffyella gerundensis TaxID=1619313 RepID=A0A0U5L8E8_9GAMM|nr:hypothetical protein EM595_3377 [Duffyella gerundensis]
MVNPLLYAIQSRAIYMIKEDDDAATLAALSI